LKKEGYYDDYKKEAFKIYFHKAKIVEKLGIALIFFIRKRKV
jgi:hypothetical protein